ncbi:hypothetical protein SAPIO_CDS1529 [Scedosporium apiospermum]|uniref:FAM50A/XAP5 C-terminal domain-containing protein n=1 Tax=Pseudallescheria apiosperma TaxID=563466 RepID=A0A084GEH6_PSEDA|nr:uncharacterized protein SAPIO_CDS1529 [Scedosporium apiospermum]KEZ45738.1 hypothetical protein SAPIO_CDS1529 [Scedosporium apiospermum]
MSSENRSRFVTQNKTTNERLSTNTVGLVALSEFRKRRAEVLEQQEREAREALLSASSTPNRSTSRTPISGNVSGDAGSGAEQPAKKKLKQKKTKRKAGPKLSFGGDEDEDEQDDANAPTDGSGEKKVAATRDGERATDVKKSKLAANASVGIVPKTLTKAAMKQEAAEREALRREFLQIQDAVKATEIAIPFVFYDGTNIPGGVVRVKKGDHVWVFLDKSRKVGAEMQVGGDKVRARKAWARVGVDDLILVRGTIIVPHHYDFYFFAINKSLGPGGKRIFDYSSDAPKMHNHNHANADNADDDNKEEETSGLMTAAAYKAAEARNLPDISTLEGANDDPTLTKVVDRRWYERNKHIYPASLWQEFDPEKDYQTEIRRDLGGNAFFYAK